MIDTIGAHIRGFVTIKDATTGEILEQTENAVHFGNISTALAKSLTGDSDGFITYMAFGNGGVIIDAAGNIVYRKPRADVNKNANEQMYNTTLIKELSNNNSGITDPDVDVPGGNTQNFEDVVARVVLEPGFPSKQLAFDNADVSNDQNASTEEGTYVFNEIALYAGPAGFGSRQDVTGVQSFINELSTLMLTHVIFHPVQKSLNRTLEITYTLRIQMGEYCSPVLTP